MNKLVKTILLFLAMSLLIASCVITPASGKLEFTDGLGRNVKLASPAKKIVSLTPPATEMLFAVGAGGQVIGRDTFSDFPKEAQTLPDVGGGFGDYNLESITALAPDLVIAGSINTPELVKSLEDLGLTVYYLANPVDLEGMLAALGTVGALSGHAKDAQALAAGLDARIKAVDDALAKEANVVTVFYELDATDPAKPYTPGPGSFYSHLIQRAGGENIGDSLQSEWAQASLELLFDKDPNMIILGDAMWGVTPETLAERPGWNALRAVKEGRIVPFDDNLLARIGPRQVDGVEALARLLHPEAFE